MTRDLEDQPYTDCECRVVSFLNEIGIGGGDDPIGFLIASQAEMARQRNDYRNRYAQAKREADRIATEREAARETLRQLIQAIDIVRDEPWTSHVGGVAFG